MNQHRLLLSSPAAATLAMLILAATAMGQPPPPEVLDASPTLTIADARIKEGDSGLTHLVFAVKLSGPPGGHSTVDFKTVEGTATIADDDFKATNGVLVFSATDTLGTIDVIVLGDSRLEGNEWFLVQLSNPVGFTFADSVAVGTIVNDERATFVAFDGGFTPYFDGTIPSAWGDYDSDGYPDLPLHHSSGAGRFAEIPGFRVTLANGNYHGGAWADYDRDGDVDLALLGYALPGGVPTPSRLLENQGNGTFVDIAPVHGMDIMGNGETAVWGDFDGDGWPDLFAPYYSHVLPFRSFLYRNNGDGRFTERAVEAGVDLPGLTIELRPEGAQAADWNEDGYLDLYCASHLFVNDGSGNFTDVREAVGLPVLFDEGAAFVDYDNDGELDLYLRGIDGPRLFRNDGGHFTEATAAAGLQPVPLLWGDSWADVDGDGDLDFILMPGGGPARLMLNQGDGTFDRDTDFELLAAPAGQAAWADYDRDEDMDLVITSGSYRSIFRNQQSQLEEFSQSRLSVRVMNGEGHETSHGATVRLYPLGGPPGFVQTRVVDGGSGYLGQNEYTVRFGGVGSGRFALEIAYPSPVGSRVVLDSLVNPLLGPIEPGVTGLRDFTVYADGRVVFPAPPVAGVIAPGPRPARAHILGQPSPVPARHSVTIPVQVERAARMSVTFHDLRGRQVRRVGYVEVPVGRFAFEWDLADEHGVRAATGVYFCRLVMDGRAVDARRLLVVR